jgi:hypothetical protein
MLASIDTPQGDHDERTAAIRASATPAASSPTGGLLLPDAFVLVGVFEQ